MRNQTGRREAVRLRLPPSSHKLDGLLHVEIRSEGRTVASGPLGSMADGAGDPIVLAPGEQVPVAITVSLPAGSEAKVAAALVQVDVTFQVGPRALTGGSAR